jgi:hypothetical protein
MFFIYFVSLRKDFLNLLAVCSTVEFVLCWCVIIIKNLPICVVIVFLIWYFT